MKTKLPNSVYKILRKKLKDYNYMQERILEIEDTAIEEKADINSGIRSKNKVGKKVENIAIKLAENNEYNELKAWKSCIDGLLIYYIDEPLKLKFLKRRYIGCELVNYTIKHNSIKDIDVIKDLELEGCNISKRCWINYKNDMLNKLYELTLENNYIKI